MALKFRTFCIFICRIKHSIKKKKQTKINYQFRPYRVQQLFKLPRLRTHQISVYLLQGATKHTFRNDRCVHRSRVIVSVIPPPRCAIVLLLLRESVRLCIANTPMQICLCVCVHFYRIASRYNTSVVIIE